VGSKTGRDGIHGATMASAEFTDDSEEKRPTVQVGDPFTEKLLIEACLELMATDVIVAIQDMGAAGLTSSAVEMASKGGVGFDLNLDMVPQREENMQGWEMMLSESQERMLMVIQPGREHIAQAIFEKWDLDFAIIGHITDTGNLTLSQHGQVIGDMPIDSLVEDAPEYERPFVRSTPRDILAAEDVAEPADYNQAVMDLVGGPHLCSRRWIYEQYDHMVMGDTVQRPGGDAGVVRVHGSNKGLAISTDVTPRYCYAGAHDGGAQAVAETWRNVTAVGAKPLAITNCLNFGNPERPEIMGQFVECLEGMGDACRALDYPIVSGNVSLYNETNGTGVLPTPAIGGVGVLADIDRMATVAFKAEGDAVIMVGDTKGHLGASLYQKQLLNEDAGAPPPVDLVVERANGDFVRGLIEDGTTNTCHDLSDGGFIAALADMAMAGNVGVTANIGDDLPLHAALFGEDQARYLIAVSEDAADAVLSAAVKAGVPAKRIGTTGGDRVNVNDGAIDLSVAELSSAHEGWLPNFMAAAE